MPNMHTKRDKTISRIEFGVAKSIKEKTAVSNSFKSEFTVSNIKISCDNNGSHTHFTLLSNLDGNVENSWISVGFNVVSEMVNNLIF
jgi:hypothetical protein